MNSQPICFKPVFDLPTFQININAKKHFENLFVGFDEVYMVTYVASLKLLLDYIEKYNYKKVTMVVGSEGDPEKMLLQSANNNVSVIHSTIKLINDNILNLRISDKYHHKFYILKNNDLNLIRIMTGSFNFTYNAQYAKQKNCGEGHDLLNNGLYDEYINSSFNTFYECFADSRVFISELVEQLKNKDDNMSDDEIIKLYLVNSKTSHDAAKKYSLMLDISDRIDNDESEIIVIDNIPKITDTDEKLLKRIAVDITDKSATIDVKKFANIVIKNYSVPIMKLNSDKTELILFDGDGRTSLTEPLPERIEPIIDGLENIEAYFNSVAKYGETLNINEVQANMGEALLYMFTAPLMAELNSIYRHFGCDPKVIKYLYVYGNANNGKTTFMNYLYKLITGKNNIYSTLPASRNQNTSLNNIKQLEALGTVYPVVFDDIDFLTLGKFKEYLLDYWVPVSVKPTFIFLSNNFHIDYNIRNRTKILCFDVLLNANNYQAINEKNIIEKQNNNIYKWFSYLLLNKYIKSYKEYIRNAEVLDILYLSRLALNELYDITKRKKPLYFLNQPIENVVEFDKNRSIWIDMFKRKTITARYDDDRIIIKFNFNNVTEDTVKTYYKQLPQNIKAHQVSNEIIIDNPSAFEEWCPIVRRNWVLSLIKWAK